MKNRAEILAPAGSFESAVAGVRGGANAIYLGAKYFSARASAQNFDDETLKQVVEYCHQRGVKVYLALNTLINNSEIEQAVQTVKKACLLPIDALIVQDTGLAFIIKKLCPDLALHASTQMAVHTASGAKLLYEQGFKRVVLARELSIEQIEEIVNSCPIEVEVFVHGALCMSVSGQCYLSAVIGQRSGNRGQCAQPCRLPFAVKSGSGNDLSLKDLSAMQYIKRLEEIGVKSLKIEGRMKRPEYVYSAVDACASVLKNGQLDVKKEETLKNVFSRSGFTSGYLENKLNKDMYGTRQKENVVTATNKLLGEISNKYRNEAGRIGVEFSLSIKRDNEISLVVVDECKNTFKAVGQIPEIAKNVPLSKEKCEQALNKTGNTQFFVQNIAIDIDENITVPMSAINNLRRESLIGLSEKIAERTLPTFKEFKAEKIKRDNAKQKQTLRAIFIDTDIPKCFKKCELIFVPLFSKETELERLLKSGFNVGVTIPRGMFGIQSKIEKTLENIKKLGVKDVLVNNIGAVEIATRLGFVTHADFALNVTNSYTANTLATFGVADFTASFELKTGQIAGLSSNIPKGVIGFGRLPLMLLRNCPQRNVYKTCKDCKKTYNKNNKQQPYPIITDRKNEKFPLICDGNTTQLLNSVELNIADKMQDFITADFIVLYFSVENYVDKVNIFNEFSGENRKNIRKKGEFTRGLYYRGVL